MNGKIYLITNTINNKKYVGQTKQPLEYRWKDHCSKKKIPTLIHKAIKKYGKENFTIQLIITHVEDQETLNNAEIQYISYYNTLAPNGYNLTLGGFCGNGMRKISPIHYEYIVKQYIVNNRSSNDIAREFGVDVGTVTRILKEHNVTMRTNAQAHARINDNQLDYILELYHSLRSSDLVAAKLNVSGNAVCRFLKRHNIELIYKGKNKT